MPTFSLDSSAFDSFPGQREFMLSRAYAIGTYSNLEQALCACLACFGNMSERTAGTIFFKINNARATTEILTTLKKHKDCEQYPLYWNSIVCSARRLAQTRNSIVHWGEVANVWEPVDGVGEYKFTPAIKPPNYWGWTDDTPEMDKAALDAFSLECRFVYMSVQTFLKLFRGDLKGEEADTWREICQRPLKYPPPPGHPLSQTTTTP